MKTKAILVIMFVVAGLVVPGWAVFPTVGVYDPTDLPWENDVDQSGTFVSATGGASAGNLLVLTDVQTGGAYDIGPEYTANMGGVVDFEGTDDADLDGQTIHAEYGIGGAKTLDITGTVGAIGVGNGIGDGDRLPTSGDNRITKDRNNDFRFDIEGITGGDDGERVIVFGGTVIGRTGSNVAPNVIATFSDGSTVTSTAPMPGVAANDEDAFFGFIAPAGEYIVSVNFNVGAYTFMDDLVFITDTGFPTEIDAGDNQTVLLSVASTTGVSLDSTLYASYGTEGYTYAWTSDPPGGVVFINATDADPTVTFTTVGSYVLTLDVIGTEGADTSDTVTISVVTSWIGEYDEYDWHDLENWSSGAVPTISDHITIGDPDYSDLHTGPITVDISAPANANSLNIGSGDDADEYATVNVLSSALLTTNQDIKLGDGDDGVGTLIASADTDIIIGDDLEIGGNGVGTFTMTGGNLSVNDNLEVGDKGEGTFTMTGGQLIVGGNIDISKDDDGTGTMTLTDVLGVTCDNIYVASNSDDGAGTGFGTLTLNDPNIMMDGELQIGNYGTGTLTSTGGYLDVNDNVEIGKNSRGTSKGTLTLNSTNITKANGDMDAKRLYIGTNSGGNGELIMTGTSRALFDNNVVIGGGDGSNNGKDGDHDWDGKGIVRMFDHTYLYAYDQMRLGCDTGAVGELYMMDPNTTLELGDEVGVGEDLIVGQWGTGKVVMSGTILLGDDLYLGKYSSGIGTVTMNGQAHIETGGGQGNVYIGLKSTDANSILTMNDYAYLLVDDDMFIGGGDGSSGNLGHGIVYLSVDRQFVSTNDPNTSIDVDGELIVGDNGVGVLNMISGTVTGGADMLVADGADGIGTVNMGDGAVLILGTNDQLIIGDDGHGYLNMGTGSLIHAGGHLQVGKDSTGHGEITMSSGAVINLYGNLKDLVIGDDGYGLLDMTGGTITVSDDVMVAEGGSGDGDVIMNGGTINVGDAIDFADNGTGAVANLTMSNGAQINVASKPFNFARKGSGTLTMSSGAIISVGSGGHDMRIGEDLGSSATVVINDFGTTITCDDLMLGDDGGSVDFTINNDAQIIIGDNLYVARNRDSGDIGGVVDMFIDNDAYIEVDNEFKIGGYGSKVTINLIDGRITTMSSSTVDRLTLPENPSEGGFAVIVLGIDANNISGAATIQLAGSIDASNAGPNDYIDFLGGGLLIAIGTSDPSKEELEGLISTGYFRTTYSAGTYQGNAPGGNEIYQPVCTEVSGDLHVYLGIGPDATVPDVVGDAEADAITAIEAAFLVAAVTTDNSVTVPVGKVISQDPVNPTKVAKFSTVNIVVSIGALVPDVVNLSPGDAATAITGASLILGTDDTTAYSTISAIGNVASQDPIAGSSVAVDTPVDIVISLGTIVPDVVGDDKAVAIGKINAAGLVAVVTNVNNLEVLLFDKVMTQGTPATTVVNPGTSVAIDVCVGALVPDVVNMLPAAARAAILAASLTNGNETSENSTTIAIGKVASQNPSAGSSKAVDTAVDIVVSLGAKVPNVLLEYGEPVEEIYAIEAIEDELLVASVTYAASTTVDVGYVISQDPTGGSSVPPYSTVVIFVSGGTVPDVVGLDQDAAVNSIGTEGLYASITYAGSTSVAIDAVISQGGPAVGLVVQQYTVVDIVVSTGAVVPNVAGLLKADAEAAIAAELLNSSSSEASHATVPAGYVIRQIPPSGGSVEPGSTVHIVVSTGPRCTGSPAGDLNDDCIVDLADLAILTAAYTTGYYLEDFAVLSDDWEKCGLESTCPPGTTPTEY